MIFADTNLFSKFIQRKIFFIMVVDIALYSCTLTVSRQPGMNRNSGYTGISHKLHHNNIHISLTKYLKIGFPILHFRKNLSHAGQYIVVPVKRINAKAALGGIGNRKF